mmetsp:Transcript_7038/g.7214  ORF Transcript_7038/g.7214 Transcript_7038/m.7214 type:complete len:192 (-) Transcript_7038:52-627(-)
MGCDPNKLAVQVLRRNIILNNIDTTRISIRCGDSRSLAPRELRDCRESLVFGDLVCGQAMLHSITTKRVEEIASVNELDYKLVCAYHKYANCSAYYEDLSAADRSNAQGLARLQGAAVPLLEVHAMDDPIAVFEVAAVDLVEQTENVMVLATKHGGHIGWPLGWRPTENRWGYMMDMTMEFTGVVCVVGGR